MSWTTRRMRRVAIFVAVSLSKSGAKVQTFSELTKYFFNFYRIPLISSTHFLPLPRLCPSQNVPDGTLWQPFPGCFVFPSAIAPNPYLPTTRPSLVLILFILNLKEFKIWAEIHLFYNSLTTNSSSHPLRIPSGSSYVLLMYFLCISYVLNINTT